jgi:hypothetical protein
MIPKAPVTQKPKLPSVPATVISKDRQIVDTSQDVWQFRVSNDGGRLVEIKWNLLNQDIRPGRLDRRACELYKLYLARRLQFSKGHTIRNNFSMLRRFLRWMTSSNHLAKGHEFSWEVVNYTIFRLFLEHGMCTGEKGNDFSRLRDFYTWVHSSVDTQSLILNLHSASRRYAPQETSRGPPCAFAIPPKAPSTMRSSALSSSLFSAASARLKIVQS